MNKNIYSSCEDKEQDLSLLEVFFTKLFSLLPLP